MKPLLFVLCLIHIIQNTNAQISWLKVESGTIKDTNGNEILLKGVQFQFGSLRGDVQYFDENDTAENIFLDNMLKHIIIEDDFEDVNNMCANAVRLSLITYRDFVNDSLLFTYKENNLQQLDSVVQWAKNNNIYLIISMRQSPGGHNSSAHSGNGGLNELWSNTIYQQRIAALWKNIAERYVNEPIIVGYDLLNEPEAPDSLALNLVYRSIIDSIRSVDTNHIVFLEGNLWGQYTDWIDPNHDPNMAVSIHFYLPGSYAVEGIGTYPDAAAGFTKDTLVAGFQNRITHAQNLNVPCWVGEFGAMTIADGHLVYDEDIIGIMDSLSLSWNYYNYKNIKGIAIAQDIYYTDSLNEFVQMLDSIQGGALFSSFSQQYLDSALISLETLNYLTKKNLKHMLTNAMCFPFGVLDFNNNNNISNIKIYPNPTNTTVTVILNQKVDEAKLYIYDITGKLLKTDNIQNENQFFISGNQFTSGVYHISVVGNGKIIDQGKIIINK